MPRKEFEERGWHPLYDTIIGKYVVKRIPFLKISKISDLFGGAGGFLFPSQLGELTNFNLVCFLVLI